MDKNPIRIIIPAILIALVSVNAHAYDNGDFQIWNTDYEDVKVYKNVKLSMEQEFRYGKNASELYYQHYDFGTVFTFDKMLDLGFFYRLVYERLHDQKWREEDEPNVDATLKFDLWKFKVDDRNRLEYRHFRYKNDSVRYRNRFTIKFPLEFKKIKFSPYSCDEMFISSDSTGFNENRLSSGVEFELTKYAKFDMYYMFKENRIKNNKWNNTNVLGMKIKIAF
jgi:hypothetical protein